MSQLLEALQDAAIKCHIGFKHAGPWEECEWIECEDRRKIIMSHNLAGADEQVVGDEERAAVSKTWTDEFPVNEEVFYWMRHKENHGDINVGLLRDRTLLLAEGGTQSKSPRKDYEYLPASPSDAEQLIELRKTHDSVLRDLKQAAFAYHVEANHKPSAFADCRNGICANACRVFNAHVESNPKQPEKETQGK